jgi:TRAP-type C4-dicarboxylate transport system permease small subunit
MWIYYASVFVGGLLMLIRYVLRLYRYLFRFDAATMTTAAREH